jgi:hypothetical protein
MRIKKALISKLFKFLDTNLYAFPENRRSDIVRADPQAPVSVALEIKEYLQMEQRNEFAKSKDLIWDFASTSLPEFSKLAKFLLKIQLALNWNIPH